MSKPFHSGKTASDGVLAAELASQGFEAAVDLLDSDKGLMPTLFQDPSVTVRIAEFGKTWEITRNSFKPYAACQLTHASIDCALKLGESIRGAEVTRIRAYVNPLAIKMAGHINAATANEGKFSLAYTIALGLSGYRARLEDFMAGRLGDGRLQALSAHVETIPSDVIERTGARVEVTLADGRTLTEETQLAFGSVGHPMGWPDLEAKFLSLAEPVIGGRADALLDVLRDFDKPGRLAKPSRSSTRVRHEGRVVTRDTTCRVWLYASFGESHLRSFRPGVARRAINRNQLNFERDDMEVKSALKVFNQKDVPTSPGVIDGLLIRKLAGDPEHPSERISVGLATFGPGTHEHLHWHLIETFHYIVAGKGIVRDIEGRSWEVGPGDIVYGPPGFAAHTNGK